MDARKIVLPIGGMTCGACSARVERGLKKLEGIVSVNVNLASEKAMIEYNAKATG